MFQSALGLGRIPERRVDVIEGDLRAAARCPAHVPRQLLQEHAPAIKTWQPMAALHQGENIGRPQQPPDQHVSKTSTVTTDLSAAAARIASSECVGESAEAREPKRSPSRASTSPRASCRPSVTEIFSSNSSP